MHPRLFEIRKLQQPALQLTQNRSRALVLMMPDGLPRLFADERGVWREDRPGSPYGIEWSEICGVGGYKLDGITEVYTVVELDHPSGHWIELYVDWPGFASVADAITAALPGIRPSWFDEINALAVRAPAITVWRRP